MVSEIMAGTVADAIRERLIAHTPVKDPHQALILAYTVRQWVVLAAFVVREGLDPGVYADIAPAIDKARQAAVSAGFAMLELPTQGLDSSQPIR